MYIVEVVRPSSVECDSHTNIQMECAMHTNYLSVLSIGVVSTPKF